MSKYGPKYIMSLSISFSKYNLLYTIWDMGIYEGTAFDVKFTL